MNAMGRFTLKSLRANRVRTLVTIAGVALAAALLTAVLTSFTSLTNYLYRAEEAQSGSWMAMVQSQDAAELETFTADALDDGQITAAATMQDVGFGQLTEAQKAVYGQYLPIIDVAGDVEQLCAVRADEGRVPQNAGEIMLPSNWRDRGDLAVGDTLTLPVGQRAAVLAEGESGQMEMSGAMDASDLSDYDDGEADMLIQDGTLLDSSIGYLDAAEDGGIFNETLTDVHERSFTVVGFYDRMSYALSYSVGLAGITVDDPEAEGMMLAFVTMSGVDSMDAITQRAEEAYPDPDLSISYHTSMLRYMGVRSNGAIWETFSGVAGVLAAVIIVACVSLIYNAFAISVAERTRQFGLLSSVGASKKQLRRAVMLEALLVALIGVPLGLLVGIGGCAVTFAALGPSIASVVGGGDVPFALHVEWWVLVCAAALTLATVLFSVFVPAWRAGRASAIDALRGSNGSRASRKGAARTARNTNSTRLWKRRGIGGRLFGMGGALARINRTRGAAKGTTAAVSLALAIVLLMTAGSLNTFLGFLVNAASGDVRYDVGISAMLDPLDDAMHSSSDENDLSAQAQAYADVYDALSQTADAEPVGWVLGASMPVVVPPEMAGPALTNSDGDNGQSGPATSGKMPDGTYGAYATLLYLNDADFDALARQAGLDPADFRDPEHLRAIATKSTYDNNGTTYELVETFTQTGTVEMLVGGTYEGIPVVNFSIDYAIDPETHEASFGFVPSVLESDFAALQQSDAAESASSDTTEQVPMEDVQTESVPVDIVCLTDEPPTIVGQTGSPRIIVPVSLAFAQGSGFSTFDPLFTAGFNTPEGNHEEIAAALDETLKAQLGSVAGYQLAFSTINDYLLQQDSNQMLATIVNVFCLLFTVILALIAMANVFNTVTNSLILRRREFAVMRSAGLSNRQFRSMIANECANFGIKGLIPGMLISVVVSYLLFHMVTNSMSGLAFNLPWAYVALAIALTAAAMGASVAFGMHRCKADNVVEALRMNNI